MNHHKVKKISKKSKQTENKEDILRKSRKKWENLTTFTVVSKLALFCRSLTKHEN